MPDTPVWLNTDDAAAYIGVTAATLRRLVARGEVIALRSVGCAATATRISTPSWSRPESGRNRWGDQGGRPVD